MSSSMLNGESHRPTTSSPLTSSIASLTATPKSRNSKSVRRPLRQQTPAAAAAVPTKHKSSSPAPCYASGKWSDSPSARAIPLPPEAWFEDASDDSDGSNSSCDVPVLSALQPQDCAKNSRTPSRTCRLEAQNRMEGTSPIDGRRICPLQLISEIMAVSISN